MKTRQTVIRITKDGQRVIGKSFVVDESETEEKENLAVEAKDTTEIEATGMTEDETIVTIGSFQYYINKVQASKADEEANEYHSQAEHWNTKLDQTRWAVDKIEERNKQLKKSRAFWKKSASFFVIALSLLGFFCGVIISIQKYLEYKGPTGTVLETLGAFLIYGAVGLIIAFVFGVLTKMVTKEVVTYCTDVLKENYGLLDSLRFNEDIAEKQVQKYMILENKKREEARKYRGL